MAVMQYIFTTTASKLLFKTGNGNISKKVSSVDSQQTQKLSAQRVTPAAAETRKVGCKCLRLKNTINKKQNFTKLSYWESGWIILVY